MRGRAPRRKAGARPRRACTALRLGTGEPRRTWRLPGQLTGLGADRAGWYAAVGTTALHAYNAHTSDAG